MTYQMTEDELAIATTAVDQLQATVSERVRELMGDDAEIAFMRAARNPSVLRSAPDTVLSFVGMCAALAISQTVLRINRDNLEKPNDEH